MSSFSHLPLQQAIHQALTGNAGLMALVTGIHDRPPQNTAFPYVTLGESSGSDWSTKTNSGMEQMLILHVWSREGGRKQAAEIMEKIHEALHDAGLAVPGHTLVMLRFVSSGILLESDGWTYHGIMRFRALLETD